MKRRSIRIQTFLLILMSLFFHPLKGQDPAFNYFYRIYMKDKGGYKLTDFTPSVLFSDRAIARRLKEGIAGLDLRDLPVYKGYLDTIASKGLTLHCTSRWMNTALFKSETPADIKELQSLPFVENVKIVKNPMGPAGRNDRYTRKLSADTYQYNNQLMMINGLEVQASGYQGWGRLIAVLDGGFIDFDNLPALESLRSGNRVTGTYDFVKRDQFVYDYHIHGSDVMCVLAGDVQGQMQGSAPGAEYLLLRTEDTGSEFPVEEDFWAAGAEYADSAGCDIISSSLGYFTFDDSLMNYKYSDMNGNTAFVTLAAEAAASRGIVVVNSAGNERSSTWKYIIAPADGANVLSVGAVDQGRVITSFSSAGPSADGRVKPDVAAQGASIPVQLNVHNAEGTLPEIMFAAGTSFSCPVISGMVACIMQAVPQAKSKDIVSVLKSVSDRFSSPDSLYGYGIPDITKAVETLQKKMMSEPESNIVIGPNPFSDIINIRFRDNPEFVNLEILTATGFSIRQISHPHYISLNLTLNDLAGLHQGLYFIRITTVLGSSTYKVIKAGP